MAPDFADSAMFTSLKVNWITKMTESFTQAERLKKLFVKKFLITEKVYQFTSSYIYICNIKLLLFRGLIYVPSHSTSHLGSKWLSFF